MTETLCSSGAVKLKAGSSVSENLTAADYTMLIQQAEAFLCSSTRYNWVDVYSTLNADIKQILEDAVSSWAALNAITYDMSGYTSREEAQVLLDVNWSKVVEIINLLRDEKFKTFVVNGGVVN